MLVSLGRTYCWRHMLDGVWLFVSHGTALMDVEDVDLDVDLNWAWTGTRTLVMTRHLVCTLANKMR